MDNTKPLTGYERFLEAAGDGSDNQLKPVTRREHVLDSIAKGEPFTDPHTREEYFLAKLSDAMHGGGDEEDDEFASYKRVKLIDYDGELLYDYSPKQFLALSSYPDPPAHDGLTFAGWNSELQDAKNYVEKYGLLTIGAMYEPTDGNMHIKLLTNPTGDTTYFFFAPNPEARVDWGDGSPVDTPLGSYNYCTHTYSANSAVYDIVVHNVSGDVPANAFSTPSGSTYGNSNVLEVVIPPTIGHIYARSFKNCIRLTSVVLPATRNGTAHTILAEAFYGSSLRGIVVPPRIAILDSEVFASNKFLQEIALPASPLMYSSIADFVPMGTFSGCTSLISCSIPEGYGSISDNVFSGCVSLLGVAIPDSVSTVGVAFQGTTSLRSVRIPISSFTGLLGNTFSGSGVMNVEAPAVRHIESGCFSGCSRLRRIVVQRLDVSSGGMFSASKSLREVIAPDGITSAPSGTFVDCAGLRELPAITGANISSGAFSGYFGLEKIVVSVDGGHFTNQSAFTGVFPHLKEVYFTKKPAIINEHFFSLSANPPVTIYCCWPEGEVAGAPWGIQNATIVYDYHGDPTES